MKPNALDRAIAHVSPRWAMSRLAWRQAFAIASASGGARYEGARTGRRTDGWITGGTSANAEIGVAAGLIRNRVRDLVRNNPHASIVPSKLAAKVWGTGIVPRLKIGEIEDPRRAKARDIWSAFCDNSDPEGQLDFYGQTNVLVRAVFESGEALLRFLPQPASVKLPIRLQIAIQEGDYIDAMQERGLPDGGVIIQGVEYDAAGRRVAYWLFDEHPGDTVISFTKRMFTSRRVPASEVRHVFPALRPGQARGVSIFAPVVMKLKDIDDYDDAELVRKKIASCFAAFVTRAAGNVASPLAVATTTDASSRRIEKLSPGMMQYLNPGEEVEFGSPPSAEGYVDYMRAQLRAVATGCGVTYAMISGDLSDVNYSSMRAGLIDFWEMVDQWQWLMMIPQVCNPVWNRVGAAAAIGGLRERSDPWTATWTPPARRWVNPKEDVEAELQAIRAGLKSLPSSMAGSGEDPDETMLEIAASNGLLDRLGIVLDSDPRKVGRASAATPSAAKAA